MALTVSEVQVWAAEIKDRAGGLAEKMEPLAKAGVMLDFVIARRTPDKPGTGVVFCAPIQTREAEAATAAGFKHAEALHSLRLEGPDEQGLGARLTRAMADAGINMRGLSAAAIGGRCVVYLAFDSADDTSKAAEVVRKLG